MIQARNAMPRKFNRLAEALSPSAGQKARGAWQTLPGARSMEARACR